MQRFTRYGSTLALGALCSLGACGKSDTAADSAAAVTTTDSSAGAMAPAPAAATGLSAANIMSLVSLSNAGEIDAGKIAQEKGTDADVKAFAKMMVDDHTAMQKEADSLGAAKGVAPEPPQPQADQKRQMNEQTGQTLSSTAKGAAFDKAYIDAQVQGHQQVLNEMQGFSSTAPDPDLKALIDKAIPKVQAHLDRAQQIQAKLAR